MPETKPRKDSLDSFRFFFFFSLSSNLYVTHLRSSSLQFSPFVVAGSLTFYNPLRVRLAEEKKACNLPVGLVLLFEELASPPHHYQLNSVLAPGILSVEYSRRTLDGWKRSLRFCL